MWIRACPRNVSYSFAGLVSDLLLSPVARSVGSHELWPVVRLGWDAARIWRRGGPQGEAQRSCSCSGSCYLENVLSRVTLLGATNPQLPQCIPPWAVSSL